MHVHNIWMMLYNLTYTVSQTSNVAVLEDLKK